MARFAASASARALRLGARALALGEEPLDLAPREHLLGHVGAMSDDARAGAVGVDERLVDEVDEALLGRVAGGAREQDRDLAPDERLAARETWSSSAKNP